MKKLLATGAVLLGLGTLAFVFFGFWVIGYADENGPKLAVPDETWTTLPADDRTPTQTSIPTSRETATVPQTSTTVITPEITDLINDNEVLQLLDSIPIEEEVNRDTYNRDEWIHWDNYERGCWTVREQSLEDEAIEIVHDGCDIQSLTLFDPYTGETFRYNDIRDGETVFFDTDHLVPLAEAHRSGGWRWDSETKRDFANDLSYEHSLVNTLDCVNRQKSDDDLARWLPHSLGEGFSALDSCTEFDERFDANGDGRLGYSEYFEPYEGAWCDYATHWVKVKARWGLSMDSAEWEVARRLLGTC